MVAESLGIVYTPIEVVDFIIRSVQAALAEHFGGASLSDEGVHVLDPFTGTGVTRLIQSGFIGPQDLARKFAGELHANEILLLAYYIAAVNIEATYRQQRAKQTGTDPGYSAFPGIVLTDTFQLGEAGEGSGAMDVFPINNARATAQRKLDIQVIFGKPPYSVGQGSANDDNQNLKYPALDASITATYAAKTSATNKNKLYDSYIRAIRWGSNRLIGSPQGGVVAYVTNGGYVDSNSLDGLRRSIVDEFHHVYVFNLRGNQRTAGEASRKEGGKVFDSGSRASVAIMLLVKQPGDVPTAGATLHYIEVADYLTRDDKLQLLAASLPVQEGVLPTLDSLGWVTIRPNDHGDWINQRSATFDALMPITADGGTGVFELRSLGLASGRDAWNYNSSASALDGNATKMIAAFNAAADGYDAGGGTTGTLAQRATHAAASIVADPAAFSWNRNAFTDVARGTRYSMGDRLVMESLYRPFHPRWGEASRRLSAMVYQLPRIFPDAIRPNIVLTVPTEGSRAAFGALASSSIPDLHVWSDGTVAFPRWIYDLAPAGGAPSLWDTPDSEASTGRRHNVTDHALGVYRKLDPAIDNPPRSTSSSA